MPIEAALSQLMQIQGEFRSQIPEITRLKSRLRNRVGRRAYEKGVRYSSCWYPDEIQWEGKYPKPYIKETPEYKRIALIVDGFGRRVQELGFGQDMRFPYSQPLINVELKGRGFRTTGLGKCLAANKYLEVDVSDPKLFMKKSPTIRLQVCFPAEKPLTELVREPVEPALVTATSEINLDMESSSFDVWTWCNKNSFNTKETQHHNRVTGVLDFLDLPVLEASFLYLGGNTVCNLAGIEIMRRRGENPDTVVRFGFSDYRFSKDFGKPLMPQPEDEETEQFKINERLQQLSERLIGNMQLDSAPRSMLEQALGFISYFAAPGLPMYSEWKEYGSIRMVSLPTPPTAKELGSWIKEVSAGIPAGRLCLHRLKVGVPPTELSRDYRHLDPIKGAFDSITVPANYKSVGFVLEKRKPAGNILGEPVKGICSGHHYSLVSDVHKKSIGSGEIDSLLEHMGVASSLA